MDHEGNTFLDTPMQRQNVPDWESCASSEHTLMRAREISEDLCRLCLFDRQDVNFNSNDWDEYENAERRISHTASNEPILMRAREISEELCRLRFFDQHDVNFNSNTWNEFENAETRVSGTPSASGMMHLTPPTITQGTHAKIEPEPALSHFNFDIFDPSLDIFDLEECETASPRGVEQATVAPATVAPAIVAPRPAGKRAPVANKQKKRKTTTTRPRRRCRKRPFKNIRERHRRAEIKDKLEELDDLCSSDAVASIVPRPSAAAGLYMGGTNKPRKVDILCDSIHMLAAMDNELMRLRARNKELKMHSCK